MCPERSNQHPDNRVIENTVECWYDLSGHMILTDPPLHDPRHECIDRNKWIEMFSTHISSDEQPVPEILLRYFERHPLTTNKPNAHMLYKCLASVAGIVLDSRPDLQEQFLRLVITCAGQVPSLAWNLLGDFLQVVGKDPVHRLPLLTRLAQQMGSVHVKGCFLDIHKAVDNWVDTLAKDGKEPALRKEQEFLVPVLLGHEPRKRRLSALLKPHRVDAIVRSPGSNPPVEIHGCVRDVSGGDDDRFGRGIHIQAKDWEFEPGADYGPFPPRQILAKRVGSEERVRLTEATVELRYLYPQEVKTQFMAQCVRGFTYKERYHLPGGGIVLLLNDSSPSFSAWLDFVQSLGDLTYEEHVG